MEDMVDKDSKKVEKYRKPEVSGFTSRPVRLYLQHEPAGCLGWSVKRPPQE